MGPVTYLSLCLLGCLIFNPSLAAPALSVEEQGASCPSNWLPYNSDCYGYFATKLTWEAAEAECQTHHASHLASIHSLQENHVVTEYVSQRQTANSPIWIGLWTPLRTLNWRWADLSPLDFLNWDNGQPDPPEKKENRVVLEVATGFKKWHDYPGNFQFSFLCKFQLSRGNLPAPRGSQHPSCE